MAPIFWKLDTVVFDYGPFVAVLICLFLGICYVGSLYIKRSDSNGGNRDHPDTIKTRFRRVAVVCALVVPFLWFCSSSSRDVKILFFGPLYLHYMDGIFKIYKDHKYWETNMKNLIWLRNHVVAPLTEEFMFRACMLPVLMPSFGFGWSVAICPLFFGVAHFHHLYEKIREGVDIKVALLQSLFQFTYTTLFGAYSAFLFLRTDHLVAPVLAHAFCNHMGFPDFREVLSHPMPQRAYIAAAFVGGLVCWWLLLLPMTDPWLYANDLYYQ